MLICFVRLILTVFLMSSSTVGTPLSSQVPYQLLVAVPVILADSLIYTIGCSQRTENYWASLKIVIFSGIMCVFFLFELPKFDLFNTRSLCGNFMILPGHFVSIQ